MSTNGNGNGKLPKRRCKLCKKQFEPSKYHPRQAHCKSCGRIKRTLAIKSWHLRNRDKLLKYLRDYRSLYLLFWIILTAASAEATPWLDLKTQYGYQDYSGSIAAAGTYQKPPDYQLSTRLGEKSWLILNKFSIRKKGWITTVSPDEQEQQPDMDEPREQGGWTVDYGSTGSIKETTLLEGDSVYGWRVQLGQSTEFLWGRGMYGDRTAAASFNAQKFSFSTYKTFGRPASDQDFMFANPDTPTTNQPQTTPSPITKGEGGDLKIPFHWRQLTGEAEVAAKHSYDQELAKDMQGLAYSLNATTPHLIVAFRKLDRGYESQISTTDTSLKAYLYRSQDFSLNSGYRKVSFSGPQKSRQSATTGVALRLSKDLQVNLNCDGEVYRQGKETGTQLTGSLSASLLKTQLNLRRTARIAGESESSNTSLTISRQEGSISLNYSDSTYRLNKSTSLQGTLNLVPLKDLRLSASVSQNVSETPTKITEIVRSSYSATFRKTTLNCQIAPQTQSYSLQREFALTNTGNSLTVGMTYQEVLTGHGLTGSIGYSW